METMQPNVEDGDEKAKKIIYGHYLFSGAMYYSKKAPSKFKKPYIWFNGLFLLLGLITMNGCVLSFEEFNVIYMGFAIFSLKGTTYVFVMIPWFLYHYQSELEGFLAFMTGNRFVHLHKGIKNYFASKDRNDMENEFFLVRKINLVRSLIPLIIVECSIYFGYISIALLDINFFCKLDDPYKDLLHHVSPFPYTSKIPSIEIFYLIYFIEALLRLHLIVFGMIMVNFIHLMSSQINNNIADYCISLRTVSQHYLQSIENDNRTFKIKQTDYEKYITKHLVTFIKAHQDLLRAIKLIQPCMSLSGSLILLNNVISLFTGMYVIIATDIENVIRIKEMIMSSLLILYLYALCHMGQTFEEMQEAIIYELYHTPWYYFTPKTRQLILIFRNQINQFTGFTAYNLYIINMLILPKALKFVYSALSLVRQLE